MQGTEPRPEQQARREALRGTLRTGDQSTTWSHAEGNARDVAGGLPGGAADTGRAEVDPWTAQAGWAPGGEDSERPDGAEGGSAGTPG